MARTYKSAQGRQIDMESLRLQNELVPAVGNMRVNARGDQLGPGGKVVKSREQMLDDHYNSNIRRDRGDDGSDEIPTSGGKVSKKADPQPEIDIFEEDDFEDPPEPATVKVVEQVTIIEEPAPAPKKRAVKKKTKPAPVEVVEEVTVEPTPEPVVEQPEPKAKTVEFEFTGDTEESVTKDPIQPADPITGFSKGGKALKGGLAKAVAKTKAYEEQKNPGPKRM